MSNFKSHQSFNSPNQMNSLDLHNVCHHHFVFTKIIALLKFFSKLFTPSEFDSAQVGKRVRNTSWIFLNIEGNKHFKVHKKHN